MSSNKPVLWQLDYILFRDKSVYINGWIVVSEFEITRLVLRLLDSSSRLVGEILLLSSMPRPDVKQAYPSHYDAFNSGFVGLGSWPRRPIRGDELFLFVSLSSGDSLLLKIMPDRWESMLTRSKWQRKYSDFRLLKSYAQQAWRLLRSGRLSSLREKLKRQLSDRPQQKLNHQLTQQMLSFMGSCDHADIHLVIDHRLGGGANTYSNNLIEKWLAEGATALILSYRIANLEPVLVVKTRKGQNIFALDDMLVLPQVISGIRLTSITYNTAVSFADAEYIPGLMLRLKKEHNATLRFLLHDFFSLCPSHFLLNAEGQFCGIPDLATCRQCLSRNPYGFTSLFQGDVAAWRQAWGTVINQADEIVAFSASSIELLKQAYATWPDGQNWIQNRKISHIPHVINDISLSPIVIEEPKQLVVGVVGQIGYHKGAKLIQEMGELIQREKASERIVVIGSIELKVNPEIVSQTGPYKRHDLAKTIQSTGVNIMLFPSIWPETFSYVTQELIELDLPLACLNLGAPAERVGSYYKGLVLKSVCISDILQELRSFFAHIYLS